ncbi:hypothetical protein MMC08_005961 [Hypocenomyce scalaris]|nr:hypothetical protein [Hypocenomyce scalaris]
MASKANCSSTTNFTRFLHRLSVPLGTDITLGAFSRVIYELNAHCNPREISPDAGFQDEVATCRRKKQTASEPKVKSKNSESVAVVKNEEKANRKVHESVFVTPPPEREVRRPSKRAAELARKMTRHLERTSRRQEERGGGHSGHKKRDRKNGASNSSAVMLMPGALPYRPSPAPAGEGDNGNEGRRKKNRKSKEGVLDDLTACTLNAACFQMQVPTPSVRWVRWN